MALVLAIVLAVVLAGVVGTELYARHLFGSKVANAVQCEVEDNASVSFATMPPVLWQYISSHYPTSTWRPPAIRCAVRRA